MKSNINILDVLYGKYLFRQDTGNIYWIDEGFTQITGYTEDDIKNGLKMLDLIPKEDLNEYLLAIQKNLSLKKECYLEHRIIKKDGSTMYVLCYGYDNYNEDLHCDIGNILIADVTNMVQLENIFKNVQDMFNNIVDNVPSGIAIYEVKNNKSIEPIMANKFCWDILGFKDENELLNGFNINNIFSKEDCLEVMKNINSLINFEIEHYNHEYKILTKDGRYIWIDFKFKVSKSNNDVTKIYMVISDITELKNQMAVIDYQNQRYELIQDLTNELYFEYDLSTDTITLPKNVETIFTGKDKGNILPNFLVGRNIDKLLNPKDIDKFHSTWQNAIENSKNGSHEFRMKIFPHDITYQWYRADFIVTQDINGVCNGLFGKIVDVNENHALRKEIRKNQTMIDRLSSIDAVTGLLNKTSFCNKFDEFIKSVDLENKRLAIVSADINDFSYVNDNFSYDAGNNMLVEYAKLLSSQKVYVYTCRIYSDFFYCLAYTDMSETELIEVINESNETFNVRQKKSYPAGDIRICAGIYFIHDKNISSTICMDNSDLARRSIKGDKLNTKLAIYNEEMRNKRSREKAVASELNEAISKHKIEVFLQPKFNMETFQIIGAEALSRWRNDDGSLRAPYTFIPVLENLGYIVQLDFYVYEQVLKLMRKWTDNNIPLMPISINFSRVHTNYENFVDRVINLANKYDIDKSKIEIEITESAFADNTNVLIQNMKRLRDAGFKIDIDDFGIGYSSLGILLDTPVDVIKIDKKFIDDLNSSTFKQNFLRQLCILINTTNKEIIFEGVELKEQSEFLCNCGFYMAQGWLFDKAIPINEFEEKYITK
ncbi:MAG: EAL domain-containing protein [Oscillospiraceae bacterium]